MRNWLDDAVNLPESCEVRGRSALPFKQNKGCDEEATSDTRHEDNGVAVGAAGGGWSGGGVVAALGAALGEGWGGA
jgi:hypothetical protein